MQRFAARFDVQSARPPSWTGPPFVSVPLQYILHRGARTWCRSFRTHRWSAGSSCPASGLLSTHDHSRGYLRAPLSPSADGVLFAHNKLQRVLHPSRGGLPCAGNGLLILQMQVAVCTLLQRFRLAEAAFGETAETHNGRAWGPAATGSSLQAQSSYIRLVLQGEY